LPVALRLFAETAFKLAPTPALQVVGATT